MATAKELFGQQDTKKTARDLFQAPVEQEQKLTDGFMSRLVGGALASGQGAMPIFDEAGAYLGEKLGVGGDISYEDRLKNIRGLEKAFATENPKTDLGLRLAGGIAATVPFSGAMAARPILAGAAYGAAQGFTGAEGGFGNRAFSGTVGGGLGAGSGYVANKFLTPAAVWAGEKAKAFEKPIVNLAAREKNIIEKNLDLAGITKEQYAANLLRSTQDDFAGELGGEALRMKTQSQGKIVGPAMQEARTAMRDRLNKAHDRTRGILEDVLGSEGNIADNLATIKQLEMVEPDLYGSVSGVIPRGQIADILNTPAGRAAAPEAMRNIANRTVSPSIGGKVPSEVPISTAHEISKSLGSQITRNPLTGAMSDPATGAPIESLRKSMVNKLRAASPEFDLAQTAAAEKSAFQDAMSQGRALAKRATGEDAENLMAVALANDANLPYARTGFHQGLLDVVESVPFQTGNPAARLATPKIANRIAEITGDAAKGASFKEKIMAEKLRMELAQRGIFGSNTAEAVASGLQDIPLSKTTLLAKGIEKFDDIVNAKSNERLAKALYATSPKEKQELVGMLLAKDAAMYVPDVAKRNAMIDTLRSSIASIPAQTGGAIANRPDIPTIRIYKKRGE